MMKQAMASKALVMVVLLFICLFSKALVQGRTMETLMKRSNEIKSGYNIKKINDDNNEFTIKMEQGFVFAADYLPPKTHPPVHNIHD
ncbi:hypothetical protein CsatB_006723 [Cannabis sativa]